MLYKEKIYENRDETKPSIEDNLNALSKEQAEKVAIYLESGHILLSFVSPTIDPFDQKTRLPVVIYTDGVYIWDSIIIHWVKSYRVKLPEEFLAHVSKHQTVPNIDLKALGGITVMGKNLEYLWLES